MSFIFFFLALSVLVLIHEAGHYLAARMFGIKAEEFGFGFPPRLLGFVKENGKWKRVGLRDQGGYPGTIWSINWLPLGGFVRIKGENPGSEHDPDSLVAKPIWQRLIVMAAGVIMNWLLAIVLFSVVFWVGTTMYLENVPSGAVVRDQNIAITEILPQAPASVAGLIAGDQVLRLNGQEVRTADEARKFIQDQGVNPLRLTLVRNKVTQEVDVTPTYLTDIGRTGIGVGLADVGTVSLPPLSAVRAGAVMTGQLTKAIVIGFGDIIRGLITHRSVPAGVSGPVGIAVMAKDVAAQGVMPFLQFLGLLSVNLAVLNFLPIPALDGGRALFLMVEAIRRKPLNRAWEAGMHNVAFLILLMLIALITVRDLGHYSGTVSRLLQSI